MQIFNLPKYTKVEKIRQLNLIVLPTPPRVSIPNLSLVPAGLTRPSAFRL